MSIRESIAKKPAVVLGVTAAIAITAAALAFRSAGAEREDRPSFAYTVDDGVTWFQDEINRVPPFDHDGRPAVRAYLFKAGDNGKPFVGYLERYNAKAKAIVDAANSGKMAGNGKTPDPAELMAVKNGKEVKKPGAGNWVPQSDPAAGPITQVKSPDGSSAVSAENF